MASKATNTTPSKQHRVRTLFAAILGTIAISLVISSILVVWLNRTLTDTNTFVRSVGPIAAKPEVQNFIAAQISDQVSKDVPVKDAAKELLTKKERVGKSDDELRITLHNLIEGQIVQVLASPRFNSLWQDTVRSAHVSVVSQLDRDDSDELTLDLSPAIQDVVEQLNDTRLKPIVKQLDIPDDAGRLDLEGTGITQAHAYYSYFKVGTWLLVLVSLVALIGSVWLSVHHAKTARRILIGVGTSLLITGMLLSVPSLVSASDPTQAAAYAVAQSLLRNLQLTALVLGVACIVTAIVYKLIEQRRQSNGTPTT